MKNSSLHKESASPGIGGAASAVNTRLAASDYDAIAAFLEEKAGIRLGSGKEYLVTSRLSRLLGEHGLKGFDELILRLQGFAHRQLQATVIDAMTTNETFWFRDPAHYRTLTDAILAEFPGNRARIWSAAASTGQEAYSIAISIQDAMRSRKVASTLGYEILGTDISPTALMQARSAAYCGVSAARGLTPDQKSKYFKVEGDCIEVLPEYRRGISFREFNLMERFVGLGTFDVIFCRNVLIYFSQENKCDIVNRFAQCLNPGGYLFVGSTESLNQCSDEFEMLNLAGGLVYRRR